MPGKNFITRGLEKNVLPKLNYPYPSQVKFWAAKLKAAKSWISFLTFQLPLTLKPSAV